MELWPVPWVDLPWPVRLGAWGFLAWFGNRYIWGAWLDRHFSSAFNRFLDRTLGPLFDWYDRRHPVEIGPTIEILHWVPESQFDLHPMSESCWCHPNVIEYSDTEILVTHRRAEPPD